MDDDSLREHVSRLLDWKDAHVVGVWYPAYLIACGWTPDALRRWAAEHDCDWSERAFFVPDLIDELPTQSLTRTVTR